MPEKKKAVKSLSKKVASLLKAKKVKLTPLEPVLEKEVVKNAPVLQKPHKTVPKKTVTRVKKITKRPLLDRNLPNEIQMEESKFYVDASQPAMETLSRFELPELYGDNKIVVMVRDPYWAYAYWEISQKVRDEICAKLGAEVFHASRPCLRVYNVHNWDFFDIEVNGGARNWYLRVPHANFSFCVEIGFKTTDGRFVAAARSNVVTTPLDHMSEVIDEQWMIPQWEKLYALSGGFGVGKSSQEIKALLEKRLQEESGSGWVTSISSPGKRGAEKERPFWMWAEAELIIYGATEPSATLTVQGRKVELRSDGTFSLRFSFPDGLQTLPIEAIRDDGVERRKVTIKAQRQTEK